jgi:hypothetical protein
MPYFDHLSWRATTCERGHKTQYQRRYKETNRCLNHSKSNKLPLAAKHGQRKFLLVR